MQHDESMLRRQHVLADFGEFALASDDLDAVLFEACRLVAEALGSDFAKVIEIEADEHRLFVRAGIGWPDGVVGVARLPMGELSSETFAIDAGIPVVVEDIATEQRFVFPEFMKLAGVRALVNVPIFLPGRLAYGLLQVDSRAPAAWGANDIDFLRTYATILGPIIDRLHKVHALRLAEHKNETLLRELQHRVKNNIGMISALIHTRLARAPTKDIRDELELLSQRVEALRLVHAQVYDAGQCEYLALRPYVTSLLTRLFELHGDTSIGLELRIDDIQVQRDVAVSLGLILNEFATNSLKYAFAERTSPRGGTVTVEAREQSDRICITIADDGCGLPTAQDATPLPSQGRGSGTGISLIDRLARHICAHPAWSSGSGTTLTLEFAAT